MRTVTLIAGTALVAATLAAAATTARPDLVVTSVSLSRTVIFPGGSFRVEDITRNRAAAGAGPSVNGYVLVYADAQQHIRALKALGRRSLARLGAGASSRGSRLVRTSKSLKPNTYWIKVCADATRSVRESNERNNCRLSPQLIVKAPPLPQ
jgi:CARDB